MDKLQPHIKKVKLLDVCQKATSKLSQKDLENLEGAYPVYGAGGYIKNINYYQQENPYIAVVKDGAGIGRTFFLPAKSSIIGTMQYLLPNNLVEAKFLYYAVKNMHLEKYYTGATIPHIYFRDYQREQFKLPEKREQIKIIEVLENVESIVEARKKQLEKLDTLIKARFVEMFGELVSLDCQWEKAKLIDVCETPDDIKCGPFGTQLAKDEYQSSGIAVWEIPQINSAFKSLPTHFLTGKKAEQLKAYSIIPGDIAMSRKGNVGKCALFPETLDAGIIHSDVLRIRVNTNIVSPCFMMHQLHLSNSVRRQIELVSSGAIMAGVNVTKLKDIEVHLPPFTLQRQFAAFVAQTDKSKSVIQKSLDETQLLFDSLMQKYFG